MSDPQIKTELEDDSKNNSDGPPNKKAKKAKKSYAQSQAERKEAFKKKYSDKFAGNTPTTMWEVLPQDATDGEEAKTHYACHLTGAYFVTARQCTQHMEEKEYKEALESNAGKLEAPSEELANELREKAKIEDKARREQFNASNKKKTHGTQDAETEHLRQQMLQLQKQVESRDRRNIELTALLDRKREDNFTLKQEKHTLILENQQLRKSLNGLLKQIKQTPQGKE